ncbi:hypothetical protein [Micrococcus sp. HOU01]|uniref:hypothetical protein n=1 Tax=Micrococcus sp. HOU01 TaxID=3101753 RepID=UPI002D79030E|nr:hypothetical protein [Micrococcus sp. HOU1]WRQ42644.1 hypothetical protein SOY78_06275 [Micrococcus sp. HOU1]
MDYEGVEGPDGVEIRAPRDDEYRTCAECGGDCLREPGGADGLGMRIMFVCPEHGVQNIVDPFEEQR